MDWLAVFQQFQAAIVGFIGFAGVILTLVVNAWIVRAGRSAAIEHDRNSLRTALVEELLILRMSCIANLRALEKGPPAGHDSVDVPTYAMTDVYDASLPKIGTLSSAEVAKVMHAYLSYRQMKHVIVAVLGVRETPSSGSSRIPIKHLPRLRDLIDTMVPRLEVAILSLGRTLREAE